MAEVSFLLSANTRKRASASSEFKEFNWKFIGDLDASLPDELGGPGMRQIKILKEKHI